MSKVPRTRAPTEHWSANGTSEHHQWREWAPFGTREVDQREKAARGCVVVIAICTRSPGSACTSWLVRTLS